MKRQRVLYRLEEWKPPQLKPLPGVDEASDDYKIHHNVLLRIEHNHAEVLTKEGSWNHCSNPIQFITRLEYINGKLIIEGYRTTPAYYSWATHTSNQESGHFVFWTRWYLYPESLETYEEEDI